jgi:hypothetical protein
MSLVPGSTALTIPQKVSEHPSIRDFGAVGDGVTDDGAAIQAAINYVAAHGRYLEVPSGRYLHSATLDIGAGLVIFGQHGANFIVYTGSGTAWNIHDCGFSIERIICESTLGPYIPAFVDSHGAANPGNPTGAKICFNLDTCSEWFIKKVIVGEAPMKAFGEALRFKQTGAGSVDDFTSGWNPIAVNLVSGAYGNASNTINNLNAFACSIAAVKIRDVVDLKIKNSFFEIAANSILMDNSVPSSTVLSLNQVIIEDCYGFHVNETYMRDVPAVGGGTTPVFYPSTSTYMYPDGTPNQRFMRLVGGSLGDGIILSQVSVNRCRMNVADRYAVEILQSGSPILVGEIGFRECDVFGATVAAIRTDSDLWHVSEEGNYAYLLQNDATSAPMPFLTGPARQVGYEYFRPTRSTRILSETIDLDGNGDHSLVLRDNLAAAGARALSVRKHLDGTYFEASTIARGICDVSGLTVTSTSGDQFDASMQLGDTLVILGTGYPVDHYNAGTGQIVLASGPAGATGLPWTFAKTSFGFMGLFHTTGHVFVGDPIGHVPSDGAEAVQLQGTVGVRGDLVTDGAADVGANLHVHGASTFDSTITAAGTAKVEGASATLTLRDTSAALDQKTFSLSSTLGSLVFVLLNDALTAVVHGLLGLFANGHVRLGDSGAGFPVDSGQPVQLVGNTTVYGNLNITGTLTGGGGGAVTSVNGHTGVVTVTASDVGLGSVANALQLQAANNLSDLGSASTARTNLGVVTPLVPQIYVGGVFFTNLSGTDVIPLAKLTTGGAQGFLGINDRAQIISYQKPT